MKKGFSLIELIISLAIISFLVLILSNLFSFNINTLNRSYEDEKEYKQAYTAMTFIDTTIRYSYKVEKADHCDSNFTAYILRDKKNISSFYFYHDNGFLLINRSDLSKDSDGKANRISECGDVRLIYDEVSKTIKVNLTSKNSKYKFETSIYVGDKLWKRLLLVFMFC